MNEIKFNIGGEVRGFKIGLGFLGAIQLHFDTNMMGLGHIMVNNPFATTPAIVYFAHKSYQQSAKKPIDFTITDVEDWLDALPDWREDKNIEQLLTIMLDSIQKYIPKTKEEDTGEKKN